MEPAARVAAEAVLLRHEEAASLASELNEGCLELLEWLRDRNVGTALITRNSRLSVTTVLKRHGLAIGAIVSREDAPPKPSPAPLHLACRRLEVSPADAWMVGDGQYDVEAGLAAGVRTVWVSHGQCRWFDAEPWMQLEGLCQLRDLLSVARVQD